MQFRSDDTIKWQEGFGRGTLGSVAISSATNLPGAVSFTGTDEAKTGNVGGDIFSIGDIVAIHQTILSSQPTPNWQFNVITGVGSGTVSFKYPLTRTYTSGAQIVRAAQYNNLTINSGQELRIAKRYDSTPGGIGLVFVKNVFSCLGDLVGTGRGFLGFTLTTPADDGTTGRQGGGIPNVNGAKSNAANGNGGGGGTGSSSSSNRAGGGGGGGNGGAGSNGANSSTGHAGGVGGGTTGNNELTQFSIGGGSGSGGGTANRGQDGRNGGGGLIVVAREINISGLFISNGVDGVSSPLAGSAGSGGSAGGSFLLKGVDINLGTDRMRTVGGAGSTGHAGSGGGGAGGRGRINIDYSGSLTGSVGASFYASFNTRNDDTIKPVSAGGSFIGNFL